MISKIVRTVFSFMTASKDLDEAGTRKIHSKISAFMNDGDRSGAAFQINRLFIGGRNEEAISAYKKLADAFPEDRSQAYNRIGAVYHRMGRYDDAISAYEKAKMYGADATNVEDNIEKALAYKSKSAAT